MAWMAGRFFDTFTSSEPDSDDELPDVSDSELESELEEDGATFRIGFFVAGGSPPSSESESDESELELVSELELGLALRFDILVT